MTLPVALDALARDLDAVRAEVHREADALSQAQADWRPTADDWSVGEILHHLTLAEINTGKLTSKLLKETGSAVAPYPLRPRRVRPLARRGRPGPARRRPSSARRRAIRSGSSSSDMRAARDRSHQSLERLAAVDPRTFTWRHFTLGEMDLGQWWMLHAHHDRDHLQQIRRIKKTPGFPRA